MAVAFPSMFATVESYVIGSVQRARERSSLGKIRYCDYLGRRAPAAVETLAGAIAGALDGPLPLDAPVPLGGVDAAVEQFALALGPVGARA
jgi:hypothetical protein